MREVYLDNASTTRVTENIANVVINAMCNDYGNPSSLHTKGLAAEKIIINSAKEVSALLAVDKSEIIFTSGATEANNLAIIGAATSARRQGKRIVTTKIEHPSVLSCFEELAKRGYDCVYVSPDNNGCVSAADIAEAVDENTVLVSVMAVNNEIGSLQPIQEIAKAVKRKNSKTLFHTDAVQAIGKTQLMPKAWGIDLLSLSGHKMHAPKGVGALYVKKGVKITPMLFGGSQQNKLRPGTESVPMIAALGEAAKCAKEDFINIKNNTEELYALAVELAKQNERIIINSTTASHILNISVQGYRSEVMLHALAESGIFLSAGSACAKGEKSYVLKAMGIPDRLINSALRISFGRENTKEDIIYLFENINRLCDVIISQ